MRDYMNEDITVIMRLVYIGVIAEQIDELDEDDWPDVPHHIVTRVREDFTRLRLQNCHPKKTNILRGREAGTLELIWDTTRSNAMYRSLEKRVAVLETSDLDDCDISLLQVYDLWADTVRIPKSVRPMLEAYGSNTHRHRRADEAELYAMITSAIQKERASLTRAFTSISSTPSFVSSPATYSSVTTAGPSAPQPTAPSAVLATNTDPLAFLKSSSGVATSSNTNVAGRSTSAAWFPTASTLDYLGPASTSKQVPKSTGITTILKASVSTSSTGSLPGSSNPTAKAPAVHPAGIFGTPNSTATSAKAHPVGQPLQGTGSSDNASAGPSRLPTALLTPSSSLKGSQPKPKTRPATPVDSLVASMTTAYVKAAGRASVSPSPARFPVASQQPSQGAGSETLAQNTLAKIPAVKKPTLKVMTGGGPGLVGAAMSQPVFGKPGWSASVSPLSAKSTDTPTRPEPSTPSVKGTSTSTGTSITTAVPAKSSTKIPAVSSDVHTSGSSNVAVSAPTAATDPSIAPLTLPAKKPAQRETGSIIGGIVGATITQPVFGKPGWSANASPSSAKNTGVPITPTTALHAASASASLPTGVPTAPGAANVANTTPATGASNVSTNTDVSQTLALQSSPPSASWLVPAEGPSTTPQTASPGAHPVQHIVSHERILKWTTILESAKKAKNDADRALAVATEEVTLKRKREDEVTERLVDYGRTFPSLILARRNRSRTYSVRVFYIFCRAWSLMMHFADAVAALEAQVSEMRAVLMIERSARQAAEEKLEAERRVLEDVRRECREPFVVPALLDAFVKLSRMGEGATEVMMEVDEQIAT
ncbi:hypothetical protein EVG20_g3862 [Dentipellis fragilis]|uniref:Uncharacterized protein n=1 Tax=Dentipellis fragilis TaxID=205917 RepID=A0A4Y9YZI1_9AGAM|nr:hypothetical protein EVG20_g3862 [Dentipellis fragilis]